MLGIIGAMDVEVNAIKEKITAPKHRVLAGIDFVTGTLEGCAVCVAQCSPGKVNAALCTQLMLDTFAPERVINIGVACSLSPKVVIKDVVVADFVCQYDMDTTAVGDPRGMIFGIDKIKIAPDAALSDALYRAAKDGGYAVHRGGIASGDTFIASDALKAGIVRDFGAICGEMEGGAIGHVCAANGVPFAVLRSISDGGNAASQMDYPAFKKIAADISTAILLRFIRQS